MLPALFLRRAQNLPSAPGLKVVVTVCVNILLTKMVAWPVVLPVLNSQS